MTDIHCQQLLGLSISTIAGNPVPLVYPPARARDVESLDGASNVDGAVHARRADGVGKDDRDGTLWQHSPAMGRTMVGSVDSRHGEAGLIPACAMEGLRYQSAASDLS
jgi:hypothetical protein